MKRKIAKCSLCYLESENPDGCEAWSCAISYVNKNLFTATKIKGRKQSLKRRV